MYKHFFSENRAVYEIMSKNIVEPKKTQTIWCLRMAYWISKPTCAQANSRAYARAKKHTHTECTQKNCAVSKVNKKCIAHPTRAQRTPSAATTVQVSHALPASRSSCLLRGRGASVQDGVAAGKGLRPTSPLATPFTESNTMRFLSLGVRQRQCLRTTIAHVSQGTS